MKKFIIKNLSSIIIVLVFGIWLTLFPFFSEDFLSKFYYMPFLGIIAATVANTTPAAAGIVYFPVLTRLQIDPATAVQFSLMIQAYGMGLGTLKWYLVDKNLFMKNVLPICLLGGTIGIIISIVFIPIDNSQFLTAVFNVVAFVFTQIIFLSIILKHKYPNSRVDLTRHNRIILFAFSVTGGLITGWIGFGIDTMFYFLLTFIFRINPAIAIVTSISLMAVLSIVGTVLNVVFNQVPLSLWYSAVPGVTIAALFLAAYIAVKIGPKNILILFAFILTADFFMTFWNQHTIPLNHTAKMIFVYILVGYLLVIHVKIFKQSYKEIDMETKEPDKDKSKDITSKFSRSKKPRR